MKHLRLCALLVLSILPICTLQAETRISGDVSGEWTRDASPYIATGQLTIPAGQRLTIEPGVEVRFGGDFMLIVYGRLDAVGTIQDSILFTTTVDGELWGGIRFLNCDTLTQLDYCIVTRGRAVHGEAQDSLGMGGNLYIDQSNITISHSRISNGRARLYGGGVAIRRSRPLISHSLINQNESVISGGGLAVIAGAPTITDVRIFANVAVSSGGGAFVIGQSNPNFFDCILWSNRASHEESSLGGGMQIVEGSSPIIRRCEFLENTATAGGGLYIRGEGSNPLIEWSYFWGNATNGGERAARVGGAIYIRGGAAPEIRYCRLVENNANQGGGLYVKEPPRCNVHNLLFLRNAATRAGGAVATSTDLGENPLQLTHCTFIGNANIGGNIIAQTAYARIPTENTVGSLIRINSSIVIGGSPLFGEEGRVSALYSNIIPAFAGLGNTELDPLFFGLDSVWFLLSGASPCVDSGDSSLANDPDGTRNDRGWMHFPRNAFDSIPENPITVELTTIDRVDRSYQFTNTTGVPIYVSAMDRWNDGAREFFINAGAITSDSLLHAAALVDGDFLVAGAANESGVPRVYRIDRDSNLASSFEQPGGHGAEGYLDLATDGGSVLYGVSDDLIVEFTTEGEFGEEFRAPAGVQNITGIASDFNFSDGFVDFYLGDMEGNIVRADAAMSELGSTTLGDTVVGLGSKGNERAVYAITQPTDSTAILWLVYPDEGRVTPLYPISLPDGYHPGGFEVTQSLHEERGSLIGLMENDIGLSDRIYALDLYTSWLIIRPSLHFLMPGESTEWPLTFAGDQMPAGSYDGTFFLTVNGYGQGGEVDARMISTQSSAPNERSTVGSFMLSPAYPNPFNSKTIIRFDLPSAGPARLAMTDLSGRTVRELRTGRMNAGRHTVVLDAGALPTGLYFLRLTTPSGELVRSITLLR